MPQLRSFDQLQRPLPPQLCANCSTLRTDWIDTVSKAALAKLRFIRHKRIESMAIAEKEAFRRYIARRRECEPCKKGFTEWDTL